MRDADAGRDDRKCVMCNIDVPSVAECMGRSSEWDVATLNRRREYYDLWALRTPALGNCYAPGDMCEHHPLEDCATAPEVPWNHELQAICDTSDQTPKTNVTSKHRPHQHIRQWGSHPLSLAGRQVPAQKRLAGGQGPASSKTETRKRKNVLFADGLRELRIRIASNG
jgi:hypothetical protein